ncbi:MAG: FAD-dependent oxidoreductase, partial [Woeseiaceae bacterium]
GQNWYVEKNNNMPASREFQLSRITDDVYDTVIIGGGITGACAAWDAAQRGLRVLLLERGDFGGATSAQSLKILHGGIRYLQHLDIKRLRSSMRERRAFLRMAPHLTAHRPFVVPTFGQGMQGKNAFRAALALLAILTVDRNRGISDPARKIPGGHTISATELQQRFPGLVGPGATGAAVFHDGVLLNPPRLVYEIIATAIEAGALAVNYCNVDNVDVDQSSNAVSSITFTDILTGQAHTVRTRTVINAAGPYASGISAGDFRLPQPPLSRDMAFVVSRQFSGEAALALQTRYKDPDAVLSRGNRHIFMVPWRDYTLIGVNSRLHPDTPDSLRVDEEEVDDFLEEINDACPDLALTRADILTVNAGLLPFGSNDDNAENLSFGKRSLVSHAADLGGATGYISAVSVRWTMGRSTAAEAVDRVCDLVYGAPRHCRTTQLNIRGCDYDSVQAVLDLVKTDSGLKGLSDENATKLVTNYGSNWSQVREVISQDPSMRDAVSRSSTIRAQVLIAARHEMATCLADIVFRRTDIGSGEVPTPAALAECADIVGLELGWNPARKKREIEAVSKLSPCSLRPGSNMPDSVAV